MTKHRVRLLGTGSQRNGVLVFPSLAPRKRTHKLVFVSLAHDDTTLMEVMYFVMYSPARRRLLQAIQVTLVVSLVDRPL